MYRVSGARRFFCPRPPRVAPAASLALLGLLALLAAAIPARAVMLTSLYVVVVPGADPVQAAQEAMRVELVRLTGSRASASDPALAALIDNAHQYVQLERSTTTGRVQVLFDESALSAAIGAAGAGLWDPNRPLLWVELVALDPATDQAMRARLAQAAEERGLPITVVTQAAAAASPATASASAAPAAPAAAATPAAAPVTPQGALDAARAAGASAALVAQASASQPGALQWTLSSPDTSGQWVGSPELAIDEATDALAGVARAIARAPAAQFACRVSGVTDLPGLVAVLAALHAAPGVTEVAVSDVNGEQLTLRLQARGGGPQLERALASERLQPAGTGADGLLEYRYVAAP